MARHKRNSLILLRAKSRAAAIESIDPKLDFGKDLSLTAYKSAITATEAQLNQYNTELSGVDGTLNDLESLEATLEDMSVRMLSGVATRFGKNSDEYEKAGGTRTRDRKRPVRKPQPVLAAR